MDLKRMVYRPWSWLLGGLVVVMVALGILEYEKRPVDVNNKNKVLVEIPPGMSFYEVPDLLYEKGILRLKSAFYWAALQKNAFRSLQAGEYELSPSMSVNEVLEVLVKGLVKRYELVVPEGFNLFDIAMRLNRLGLCSATEFLQLAHSLEFLKRMGVESHSLEGYLFPDTYWFVKKTPVERIAETMIRRFWQVWNENGYGQRAKAINMGVNEVLTLASIIEKETAILEERPLVSAVFWNRLKRGMPLQADPTVIYGLLSQGSPTKDTITTEDLRAQTPYNTYVLKGLPRGPICNPGVKSIEAALFPADVPYLYFVAQANGSHHFSVALKEHNAAVSRYRRGASVQDDNGRLP